MESDSGKSAGRVQALRRAGDPSQERALWAAFRDARTPEAFYGAWLALQCQLIPDVSAGLVVAARSPGEAAVPVASWPQGSRGGDHLVAAAERVLRERHPLALQLEAGGTRRTCLAHPVESDGELVGAAILEVGARAEPELESALRQLAWGSAWLELAAGRELGGGGRRGESLRTVLELVSIAGEHERFQSAATALATELASRLRCDRVSLGFVERGHARLRAVSHSAIFDARANLARAVEGAMDEALDQERVLVHPAPRADDAPILRCHEQLAELGEAGAILTVPVTHGSRREGALCLERKASDPWSPPEIQLVETVADLVGPTLDVRRRDDRWLGAKVLASARESAGKLVGPRHVAAKLVAAAVALLVLGAVVAKGDYRVTADANLEARVLRAAVAPFDGYVAEAPARAGDRVREGDLLAVLDDREQRLERERWASQLEQLVKEYRRSLAERDAAQIEIHAAQIAQARAQLALAEAQLRKTRLEAPFDGIVVTGDLSQQLGAPVARGDLLYEVAPLDAYRLALAVDERDIDDLATGQRGTLVFAAFPETSVDFEVEQITPVSTPEEGRNTFRVEASLLDPPPHLQPGMEGVAKVEIDRRRLAWIWGHDVLDWLRLARWRWLP